MLLPRPEKLSTFRITFRDGERFDVVAEDAMRAMQSAKAMRPISKIVEIAEVRDHV